MNTHSRPPDALRTRVLEAAARQTATRPGTWRRRAIVCVVLAFAWVSLVIAVLGVRHDLGSAPVIGLVETLLVLVGVATAASAVGMTRGRAMAGAASETMLAVVAGLSVALFVAVSAIDPRGPGTLVFPGAKAALAHSMKCDLLVAAVALPLIGLGWAMWRELTLARPTLSGACLGLGAATWAHAVVRMHCPVGGAAHAIVAHLLPAIPLMALSAWAFSAGVRRAPGIRR